MKVTETASPSVVRARMPHLGALDGLRALAVMAVIAYHSAHDVIPGGFFGVEIFFVVSGYLITALLLDEYGDNGYIAPAAFWTRRLRRLVPSVMVVLAATTLWAAIAAPDILDQLRGEVAASLGYVTNWLFIFREESYFESFGRPSPLRHLWSLAIEEQFYLFWPMVVAFCLRHGGPARLRRVALVAGSLSALWAIVIYTPWQDPSRVYFGTDTRLFGLLAGAALATGWRPWERRSIPQRGIRVLGGVGLVSATLLTLLIALGDDQQPWVYQGGMVAVSILSVLTIAGAVTPNTTLGRLLATRQLQSIGQRSYALYLWSWPVTVFTRPNVDIPLDGTSLLVFRIALTAALAELTFQIVESPFRAKLGLREMMRRRATVWTGAVALATVLAVLVLATPAANPELGEAVAAAPIPTAEIYDANQTGAPWTVPPGPLATAPTDSDAPDRRAADEEDLSRNSKQTRAERITEDEGSNTPSTTTATTDPAVQGALKSPSPSPVSTLGPRTVVIGDSVALGATSALRDLLGPDTVIDAVISRQMSELPSRLAQLAHPGLETVIVHLGTNGTAAEFDIIEALATLDPATRIHLVTTHSGRAWEGSVNETLRSTAAAHGLSLIDFNAQARPDWFVDDGIHLSRTGQSAYAQLIANAVGSN